MTSAIFHANLRLVLETPCGNEAGFLQDTAPLVRVECLASPYVLCVITSLRQSQ